MTRARKYLSWTIAAYALSVAVVSCAGGLGEDEPDVIASENTLVFQCQEAVTTKSTEKDGSTEYNENKLTSIDVFLYPLADTTSDALVHERFLCNKDGSVEKDIYLDDVTAHKLFGSITTCAAFAIANVSSDLIPDKTDIASLRSVSLEAAETFKDNMPSDQKYTFVMAGKATDIKLASLDDRQIATGKVELGRVASKVTVSVCVSSEILTKTITTMEGAEVTVVNKWVPDLDEDTYGSNLLVGFYNATGQATVGAEESSVDQLAEEGLLFDYDRRSTAKTVSDDVTYYTPEPFYSYPLEWQDGSVNEPHMKLAVAWAQVKKTEKVDDNGKQLHDDDGNPLYLYWYNSTDGSEKTTEYDSASNDVVKPSDWSSWVTESSKMYYYKVFLPMSSLECNHWYDLGITVGVLGSEIDDLEVKLDAKYCVADWVDELIKHDAGVSTIRYLNVIGGNATSETVRADEDADATFVFYNSDNGTVPYVTSHALEIVDIEIKREDYSTVGGMNLVDVSDVDIDKLLSFYVEGSDLYVNFSHKLNNDIDDPDFDIGAYHITFTLRHSDDATTKRTVEIIQYPAIYVTSEVSNGSVFVNGYGYGKEYSPTTYYQWNYTCKTTVYKATSYERNNNGGGPGFGGGSSYTYSWGDEPEDGYPYEHDGTTEWSTDSSQPSSCGEGHSVGTTIVNYYKDWWSGEITEGDDLSDWNRNSWQYALKTEVEIVWSGPTEKIVWEEASYSGSYAQDKDGLYLGTMADPSSFGNGNDNENPYIYTIHVTVLPSGSKYFVADPTETLTDASKRPFNKLSFPTTSYRSTMEDAGYDYALSPEYSIASSYGKSDPVNFTQGYLRAASYQESGYPMGRWRMPTFGEVKLAQRLSEYGKIPKLFDGYYWYASCGNSWADSDVRGGSVRPVYDKWYWGEDPVSDALTTPAWHNEL